MIEFVLNSAWLVLVACAVTVFLRKNARKIDKRAFLISLGALVCAASLLLPSISITDDLHFEAFVVEDSNSTKRVAHAGPNAAPVAPVVWLVVALCGILPASRLRVRARITVTNVRHYISSWSCQPLAGRAPPQLMAA